MKESNTGVRVKTVYEVLRDNLKIDTKLASKVYLVSYWNRLRHIFPGLNATSCEVGESEVKDTYSVLRQPVRRAAVHFVIECNVTFSVEPICNPEDDEDFTDANVVIDTIFRKPGEKRSGLIYRKPQVFVLEALFDFSIHDPQFLGVRVMPYDMYAEWAMQDDAYISLNKYLLPVFPKEDYDRVAENMLLLYYPEALSGAQAVDVDLLAERMGLSVREYDLPADSRILGTVFFDKNMVDVIDETGSHAKVQFREGDILINKSLCGKMNQRESTIIHECCHAMLDRFFFGLQRIAGEDFNCRAAREVGARTQRNTPIDWMELQASKLPAHIMMPKVTAERVIAQEIQAYGGERSARVMNKVVMKLAQVFKVSKSMAKIRMIELGYPEADGVMNYGGWGYLPDYQCGKAWKAGITYTISSTDAVALLKNDERFRAEMMTGRYIYIEKHFCLNTGKYIEHNPIEGLQLTFYARMHIDECCLGFTVNGRFCDVDYIPGTAARTKNEPVKDRYLGKYNLSSNPEETGTEEENRKYSEDFRRWAELAKRLPPEYTKAVREVMKAKNVTQENLIEWLGVDRSWVFRIVNSDRPKLKHVVALCIALELPYIVSAPLILRSGNTFTACDYDGQLQMLLFQSGNISINRCNRILTDSGYEPLT